MRKPAPVQATRAGRVDRRIAEVAYRDYARRYGRDQTLERLLERGGFSWGELVFLLFSEVRRLEGDSERPRMFTDWVEVDHR